MFSSSAAFYADDNEQLNNSTSCHPEAMCKEESCLQSADLDYEDGISELCREFEKLSLYDNEEKSSSSEPNDNNVKDSSSKSDANSFEDSSYTDSDEDNDTAIERQGNIMDYHIDDYTQSAFVTSSPSGDKKFRTEENSEVIPEIDEESFPICIDMIVSSEEYLSIQDNLEHAKLYKDYLYRESLKKNPRREKNILFDVLPTIVEESTPLMDDTLIASEEEINTQDRMNVPHEMISNVEDEPVTSNMRQRKSRLKSFRKWLSRIFCCCCSTKDPP